MSDRILIEPEAFAGQGLSLEGRVALQDLDERVRSPDLADLSSEIVYSLQGGKDRWQRLFLNLSVQSRLGVYCQRCMQPMDFPIDEAAHIVLFADEAGLDEAMMADDELEGMVAECELDVLSLVEDQLLMALPFSPRHEQCSNADLEAVNQDKPNPFAALAGLKKTG